MQWLQTVLRWIRGFILFVFVLSLVSCKQLPGLSRDQGAVDSWSESGISDRATPTVSNATQGVLRRNAEKVPPSSKAVVEVSPPVTIQDLKPFLEKSQPQVKILNPAPESLIQDTTLAVAFQVENFPLFKDPEVGLGPHLQVFLDNQPYREVYDLAQPLILRDLTPGTHTIRAIACYPWNESFKQEGAYDQVTFHVFTVTQEPLDSTLPLLTYGTPQGDYGAEPILLDIYIAHPVIEAESGGNETQDDTHPWQVQVTINGFSFEMNQWKPLYLKGFKSGKNWVRVALLDEQGDPLPNQFNDTVRLVTLTPDGQDSLAKLVRGELTLSTAQGIVDPNYTVPEPPPDNPEVRSAAKSEPISSQILPDLNAEAPSPTESTSTSDPNLPERQPPRVAVPLNEELEASNLQNPDSTGLNHPDLEFTEQEPSLESTASPLPSVEQPEDEFQDFSNIKPTLTSKSAQEVPSPRSD
jgi:hypothetical protein